MLSGSLEAVVKDIPAQDVWDQNGCSVPGSPGRPFPERGPEQPDRYILMSKTSSALDLSIVGTAEMGVWVPQLWPGHPDLGSRAAPAAPLVSCGIFLELWLQVQGHTPLVIHHRMGPHKGETLRTDIPTYPVTTLRMA